MGLRSDLYGSVPGQSAAQETFENVFRWGRDTAGIIVGAQLDQTTIDAGNTPTSVLRPGLLLGAMANGNMVHYGGTGAGYVSGILMSSFRMTDLDGNLVNRFVWMLAAGPVKAQALFGLDEQARAQMFGRFIFDDRGYQQSGGPAGGQTIAKPTGYTVTTADSGTTFTTTGATGPVTFVLPTTITKGSRFTFLNTVNQTMTITAPAGKLIGLGNAAATSVAFSTAGQMVGSGTVITADDTGTKWVSTPTGGTATYT